MRQIRLHLIERDARLQPADRTSHAGPAVRHRRRVAAERAGRGRHIDVHRLRILRKRRQHADHGVRPVVHLENATDDRGIAAERAAPVVVGEEQHRGCAGPIVVRRQQATVGGADAEHRKVVGRHHAGRYPLRLGRAPARLRLPQQDEPHRVELGQRVEPGGPAIVAQFDVRERVPAARRVPVLEDDENRPARRTAADAGAARRRCRRSTC